LKGQLDGQWSAWFDNMTIGNKCGPMADRAALHSVLIHDLGLPLIAVCQVATAGDCM
jgi:hypothetical protein